MSNLKHHVHTHQTRFQFNMLGLNENMKKVADQKAALRDARATLRDHRATPPWMDSVPMTTQTHDAWEVITSSCEMGKQ